jgi:hypothetical protein
LPEKLVTKKSRDSFLLVLNFLCQKTGGPALTESFRDPLKAAFFALSMALKHSMVDFFLYIARDKKAKQLTGFPLTYKLSEMLMYILL